MSTNCRREALVAIAAAAACLLAVPALACDINSPTDISCGPISVNPANPLSPNNPSNPNSPLNINNPANPNSPSNINNPANPLSPFNPANQRRARETDPNSPYFSEPTYADGIFGLFETNPRIVYPAGQPQTCRLGLDCPADVAHSSGATLYGLRPVAQVAAPEPDAPAPRPRHHRRHRTAR